MLEAYTFFFFFLYAPCVHLKKKKHFPPYLFLYILICIK